MQKGWHNDPEDSRYRRYHDGQEWTRRRVLEAAVDSRPEPAYKGERRVVIIGEPPSIYVTQG